MNDVFDPSHCPSDHRTDPADDTTAATPAWMNTAANPLEAVLSSNGHDITGRVATLWPLGEDTDTATRAGRYVSDTNRHPQRTRAVLVAHVIARYSQPGQYVFDGFAGSGTTLVEAVYSGRHAVGVEIDSRWVDLATRNLGFATQHGATGSGLVIWADTRRLAPIPRRLRHRVDLVLATPPLQFKPDRAHHWVDDPAVIAALEHHTRAAISSWMPLLHPGSTLVFTSRLWRATGYRLDPSVPIAAAARSCGLQFAERVAALRVPVREAMTRSSSRTVRRSRQQRALYDDVLVFHVRTPGTQWRAAGGGS